MSIESEAPSPATRTFAIERTSRRIHLGIIVFMGALCALSLFFLFALFGPYLGRMPPRGWLSLSLCVGLCVAPWGLLAKRLLPLIRRGPQLWLHADGHFEHVTRDGRRVREQVSDFEGFRLTWHQGRVSGLHLVRRDGHAPLGLQLAMLEDTPVIFEWFEQRMISLDQRDLDREREVIEAQQTSDQEDAAVVLPRLARLSRWGVIWLSVASFGMMLIIAPRPYFDAWFSLSADVTLGLLLFVAWEMARHRQLVTIVQKQVQFRPAITAILWPLFVASMMGLAFPPIEELPRTLTWGAALVLAFGLASLPAAPEVTQRQRFAFGLAVFVLSIPLVNTLNVGLSPSPVHEIHTAHVTAQESIPLTRLLRLRWSFDQPVGTMSQGQLVRGRSQTIGDPIEVDLARGPLGLHWAVGVRSLVEPMPAMKTDSQCR